MDYSRNTVHINKDIVVPYDKDKYKRVINQNTRWNIYEDKPIENAGELCYVLRKVVNSDPCRLDVIRGILADKRRVIVFYNYDYELELLKTLSSETTIAEWNGHKHQPIPETNEWLYLVQYNAGSEGWNCIKTDTIVFYSQNYSYRTVTQAAGRIDRLNTPYKNLYYYTIKSKSSIDLSIARALKNKKKFNETRFASGL
jgi:superfamily II DNA or RNA helicase